MIYVKSGFTVFVKPSHPLKKLVVEIALTPIEAISSGDYICVNCSGLEDSLNIFAEKINKLDDEEDILNLEIIRLQEICDNLKSTYINIVGSSEKSLVVALESLNVVCQAYHGKVMVGNHCLKVLANYEVLTPVINEDENLCQKFNDLFSIFNGIMLLSMCNSFLNKEEILALT